MKGESSRICLWFPHEGRVPHISLVCREMWDTTDVDGQVHRMNRVVRGRCSGIPHLAKNERDMGHSAFVSNLKVKAEFRRQRTRRDIVRTAEGRKKVIECSLVRHIDPRHLQTPLEAIAIEEIVVTDRSVEQTPLLNAGGIMVIIAGARGRNPQQRRAVLRCQARRRQRRRWRCLEPSACQSCFELLVRGQAAKVHCRLAVQCCRRVGARAVWIVGEGVVAGRRSGYQAAVKAPVKADPRAAAEGKLVLDVCSLVEPFIVIDSEGYIRAAPRSPPLPPPAGGRIAPPQTTSRRTPRGCES